jgi:hypothetical protein
MDQVLRPMSTSQLLDRTFHLYRNNFVLFAGIAILTPALRLVAQLVLLKAFGPVTMPQTPEAVSPQFFQAFFVRIIINLLVVSALSLIGTALASSATAYAVSMVHLGKSTTIAESYQKVKQIFGRILGLLCAVLIITFGPLFLCYAVLLGGFVAMLTLVKSGNPGSYALFFGLGMLLVFLLMAGSVVWMFFALCRYALAVPACTLEGLPVRQSIRRSRFLSNGAKGGIFGIILLTGLLTVILTYVLELPALLASSAVIVTAHSKLTMASTIWLYVAQFLGGTLAGPIATVALVLVYYDQRIRKEAFDLQLMMDAVQQQPPQSMAVSAPPQAG